LAEKRPPSTAGAGSWIWIRLGGSFLGRRTRAVVSAGLTLVVGAATASQSIRDGAVGKPAGK
jgi:hypothetical protein